MKYIGVAPLELAVTSDEFKRAVHILEADDDPLIEAYLHAAIEVVETACRRPMLSRPVEFIAPVGSFLRWWFPVAPVVSLDKIAYMGDAGGWVDIVDLSEFRMVQTHDEPQLVIPTGHELFSLGDGHLRVQATVGHEAGSYPLSMKQAVILLVKEWFEAGIAVEEAPVAKLAFGIDVLIKQKRYMRPCEVA